MAFLTQEQLDALAQFDTPTICNAIEGFGVRGRTEGFTRAGASDARRHERQTHGGLCPAPASSPPGSRPRRPTAR